MLISIRIKSSHRQQVIAINVPVLEKTLFKSLRLWLLLLIKTDHQDEAGSRTAIMRQEIDMVAMEVDPQISEESAAP